MPQQRPGRPDDLPPIEKLQLVMEATKLSQEELGAFLRRHGLHEAQFEEWRQAALDALQKPKKRKPGKSQEAKKIKELERELARKDKALAEVTALLALKKKLDALLGGEDDDTTARNAR
jgi:transposase-like protein